MPKKYFWPIAMIVMGLIFLASNVGLLPRTFWDLWPLILIVVGLGGLLTADRDEWYFNEKTGTQAQPPTKPRSKKK